MSRTISLTTDDHEQQKVYAIMVQIAAELNLLDVPPQRKGSEVLSLALDHIRKTKRPAGSDPVVDRLRKILEKTDAIRDDIAATIRISA